MAPPLIGLLSDFGTRDTYVAAMKAAILGRCPEARMVDITHDVPPQNVRNAAFHLMNAAVDFPPGAITLAVVDPGVGTERAILVAEAGERRFVAPDNGVLSWVFWKSPPSSVWRLKAEACVQAPLSQTFHGRDIMAPAVGLLASGVPVRDIADPIDHWRTIPPPHFSKVGAKWEGEVVAVDRFGNLVTSLPSAEVDAAARHAKLWFELREGLPPVRGLVKAYAEADPGRLLAIAGSSGFIEFAVRDGDAAVKTGLREGDKVVLLLRV